MDDVGSGELVGKELLAGLIVGAGPGPDGGVGRGTRGGRVGLVAGEEVVVGGVGVGSGRSRW